MTASPPGLDLDRLAGYLRGRLRLAGPLSATVITGGKSNLTYRVTDGASVWAVRRPPLGHVLPAAHDMARECRMLSALAGTEVPVPAVFWHCADEALLGAPFYLMEYVDGEVLREPAQTASLSRERAAGCGAALHAVDPVNAGLGDFGRHLAR